MKQGPQIVSDTPVTLVGGGPVDLGLLGQHIALAPTVIAADGGARHVVHAGLQLDHVVGDMDSVDRSTLPDGVALHSIPEQMTTDLDKCLYTTQAPYFLAHGFVGGRGDHHLAACHSLVRAAGQKVILVGPEDVTFLAPLSLTLDLPEGTRVSLFPMGGVRGTSQGLRYPLDPHHFAPDSMIGTSNEVKRGPVRLTLDAPKMLVILPLEHLGTAITALGLGSP